MNLPKMQPQNQQPQEVNPASIPQPQGQPDPTEQANQAKSNMGFVNTLQEHLLEYKHPQAPQDAKTAPGEEKVKKEVEQPKPETKPEESKPEEKKDDPRIAELELSITKKLDDIRQELKGDHETEIDALKKQIEDALADEQG